MDTVTVSTVIHAPREEVWKMWTEPAHIVQWYFASDDWHAPHAENDLSVGGRFMTRMAARDGSSGFDFGGTYTEVSELRRIGYTIDDGRKALVTFVDKDGDTEVIETFETEMNHPVELQKEGWQAILGNFKKHVEGKG